MTGLPTSWFEVVFWLMLGALEPNASAPLPGDTFVAHLPERCELLVAADVRGADEGVRALQERWSRPELLLVPDVREGLAATEMGLDFAASEVVTRLGLAAFTELEAFTLCLNLGTGTGGLPELHALLMLHGASGFGEGMFRTLGADMRPVPGHAALEDPWNDALVYSPAPDTVVWGWRGYVEPLLEAPVRGTPEAGGLVAQLEGLAPHDVRWFVGFDPGLALRFLIASFGPPSLSEHVNHLDTAILAGNFETVFWRAQMNGADGLADFEVMLTGVGALARATPLLFEALTALILGSARPGDTAYSEQVQALVAEREVVLGRLREADAFAPPTVEVVVDAGARSVTLTMTETRGLQLLTRQLLLLAALARAGYLPETLDSFSNIPRWWGSLMSGGE